MPPAGATRRHHWIRRPRPDEPPSDEGANSTSFCCCMLLTQFLTIPPLPLDLLILFELDLGTVFAALDEDFLLWHLPTVDWMVLGEALECEVDVDVVS